MDKTPGVLIANQIVRRPRPAPRLRLLIEWESRRRVFFENLGDLLLRRRVPPIAITSRPARFWNDVFVPVGAPWSSFVESLLWHMLLLILLVWGQSRVWTPVKLVQPDTHRTITYYPPAPSFPAKEGRATSPRARATHTAEKRVAHQPAHQAAIPVTPEHKPSLITPPDIKQAAARPPDLPDSHAVTPIVPFPATSDSRRNTLAGASAAVAPPPKFDQNADQAVRQRVLPQTSAVAPAPDLAGSSAGRASKAPNPDGLRVVPPPPSVQNAGTSAGARRVSSLANAAPNVVPPAPSVQGNVNAGRDARLSSMPGAGSQVVPPPPSVQGAGNSAGTGRMNPLSSAGSQVVPPPPSVQGSGAYAGGKRLGSLSSSNSVVPPPPSVQSAGNSAGGARLNSLAGAGSQVVPPPPSVQGSGSSAGGTRVSSLSGAGSQVVPPPPSVQGAGSSAGGTRLNSLSGAGSVVPPPPSIQGAGNSAGGARVGALSGSGSEAAAPPAAVASAGNSANGPPGILEPMDPLPTDSASASSAANNVDKATFEELPLGLLGVVFAAPGTSFFSNFEVFVAKRRVGKSKGKDSKDDKDQLQLIKLVYEFLPYQRRLSEYNLNNLTPRVIKLKVTPDPSCNESLGQMMQAHLDPNVPTSEYPKLPEALRASDLNAVLPCYRTTATDFLQAMSRAR